MGLRNLFMSLTLMMGFMTFAFEFDDNSIKWLWEGNEPVAIILGITSNITGILWIIQQRKLNIENKKKIN